MLTLQAVLFVLRQTPYLPYLQPFSTGARARTPLCGEPTRLAGQLHTRLHGGRLLQMRTLTGWCNAVITPLFLDTDDISSLSSLPALRVTLSPGSSKPHGYWPTRSSVAGLHVRRLLPHTLALTSSPPPHTHHLPGLDARTTLSRACVCPLAKVPVGNAGSHMTVFTSHWPHSCITIPVAHHVTMVTHTTHTPTSLPRPTIDRTRAPVGGDLPVGAEAHAAGLCGGGAGQGGTALGVNHGAAIPETQTTLKLPLLEALATRHTALRPRPRIPEGGARLCVTHFLL